MLRSGSGIATPMGRLLGHRPTNSGNGCQRTVTVSALNAIRKTADKAQAAVHRAQQPRQRHFIGTAFSEPKLLGYGYDFEHATKALTVPKMTPVLPGDAISK
jgi:hypothetical protein